MKKATGAFGRPALNPKNLYRQFLSGILVQTNRPHSEIQSNRAFTSAGLSRSSTSVIALRT
jgi:hypothetical protein